MKKHKYKTTIAILCTFVALIFIGCEPEGSKSSNPKSSGKSSSSGNTGNQDGSLASTYTISFYQTKNGTKLSGLTYNQTAPKDGTGKATKPINPKPPTNKEAGFTSSANPNFKAYFTGWHNVEGDGKYDFTKLVTKNLKLYAQWSATTHQPTEVARPGTSNVFSFIDAYNSSSLYGLLFKQDGSRQTLSLDKIDTSKITDMKCLFLGKSSFNEDISGWDVSNVKNMMAIFTRANAFNQDIGGWNVENVEDMFRMFHGATAFNQDIGSWNVGKVTDMAEMFTNATDFNQDIGSWNVDKVTRMIRMFRDAKAFNQDMSQWNWKPKCNADVSHMFNGSPLANTNNTNKQPLFYTTRDQSTNKTKTPNCTP